MENKEAGEGVCGFLKKGFRRPFLLEFQKDFNHKTGRRKRTWESQGWQYWESGEDRLEEETRVLSAFLMQLKPGGKLDFCSISTAFSENKEGWLAATFYIEGAHLVLYKVFVNPTKERWSVSSPIYDKAARIIVGSNEEIVGSARDAIAWLTSPSAK